MRAVLLSSLSVLGLVALAPLPAQSRIAVLPKDSFRFGKELYRVGDLDKDGVDEVLILSDRNTVSTYPVLELWSLAGMRRLQSWPSLPDERDFGEACATVGDLDSDGMPEVLVGAPGYRVSNSTYGKVICFSTGTGKRLFELVCPDAFSVNSNFGVSVAGPGDLDLDGVPDILVGLSEGVSVASGVVYAFSGKDRKLLTRYFGPISYKIGRALTPVGDVDSDKIPDFAVLSDIDVGIISGKSGSKLAFYNLPAALASSGSRLAFTSIPDYDADGHVDLFLGLYGLSNTSGAVVLSSKSAKVLASLTDPLPPQVGTPTFGFDVTGLPDEDNDGKPELAVLDPNENQPGVRGYAVYVFSSKSGKVLRTLYQEDGILPMSPTRILSVGDANRDRIGDLLLGAQSYLTGPGLEGVVELHSSRPLDLQCAKWQLSLFEGGQAVIDVHGGAGHAGDLVLMVGSGSGTLPGIGFLGQTLLLNPDPYLSFTLSAPLAVLYNNLSLLDAQGEGKIGFTLPPLSPTSLGGTVLHHSAILVGTQGLQFANTSVRLGLELF